ncbi:hypothetical protein ACFL09_00165 [Planctomycetota bacterium]
MGRYVETFLRVLAEYGLCDRRPELAQYRMMAEMGRLSEGQAKVLLHQFQGAIDDLEDFPVHLHRPPTAEQLHAEGKADIEFLTLVESEEELRYGIRLFDRPRHVISIGSTGSGKTTSIRAMILKVHEHNQRLGEPEPVIEAAEAGGPKVAEPPKADAPPKPSLMTFLRRCFHALTRETGDREV